jgi:hypothetical protein
MLLSKITLLPTPHSLSDLTSLMAMTQPGTAHPATTIEILRLDICFHALHLLSLRQGASVFKLTEGMSSVVGKEMKRRGGLILEELMFLL